jgi:predicted naringenin-chalcone synthase
VTPHLNAIGTAVPPNDVHEAFLEVAPSFLTRASERKVFARMAERSGIRHRHSCLRPSAAAEWAERYDTEGFYRPGTFPTTADRMRRFARDAPDLVDAALADLDRRQGRDRRDGISHVVICTCTGFAAPGLDQHLIDAQGIDRRVERVLIGFMGCNAAINGYKTAWHIVRSDPRARVLVINLELCSLHFQEGTPLGTALMFMLFGDGAAAGVVSAEPSGLALLGFRSDILPGTRDRITWNIGNQGFDMWLSGRVPEAIRQHLPAHVESLRRELSAAPVLWAIHPGGRSILDAVENSLGLAAEDLAVSRGVLRDYGNMSSATLPFVLQRMMDRPHDGRVGLATGFGPGISVESMIFREAGP